MIAMENLLITILAQAPDRQLELGREMAARIEGDLGEDIVIESRPRLEGRQMVMMIAPKKK